MRVGRLRVTESLFMVKAASAPLAVVDFEDASVDVDED
jgi:hypothetical protein